MITVAAGFPTTVNPIIQNGLVPVFVDVTIPTYNIDVTKLEGALSERTRAIMIAHTLGNPFDLDAVTASAKKHDLWLVEDCCDAVGATYKGQQGRHFRRPGDRQLLSRAPHHHGRRRVRADGKAAAEDAGRILPRLGPRLLVRAGQGQYLRQAVRLATRRAALRLRPQIHLLAHRLQPEDDRYAGGRRRGAARKAAGIHRSAARQLPRFTGGLKELEEFFILPEATPDSDPSWFGFPIAVRPGAPFTRNQVDRRIWRAARSPLACCSPAICCASRLTGTSSIAWSGSLENTDFIMNQVFWIGVYPGITEAMVQHVVDVFKSFTPSFTVVSA